MEVVKIEAKLTKQDFETLDRIIIRRVVNEGLKKSENATMKEVARMIWPDSKDSLRKLYRLLYDAQRIKLEDIVMFYLSGIIDVSIEALIAQALADLTSYQLGRKILPPLPSLPPLPDGE
jgi:hypothetical protein